LAVFTSRLELAFADFAAVFPDRPGADLLVADFFGADFLAVLALRRAAALFAARLLRCGGWLAISGASKRSDARPSADGDINTALIRSNRGGSSAFSAFDALSARSFTASENFSRIDFRLAIKAPPPS
jgi:hypothetical protein